nr:HAD family hydrolase [Asaia astilbis]
MAEHDLFPGKSFDAFLFDMDGTILTSIIAAERVWTLWAQKHGLDVAKFLPTIHGVQTIETIRRQKLPGVDPVAEAHWITSRELEDTQGIDPIPGATAFLKSLPEDRWAIVTSASRDLALKRIQIAGLPLPKILITLKMRRTANRPPTVLCLAHSVWVSKPKTAPSSKMLLPEFRLVRPQTQALWSSPPHTSIKSKSLTQPCPAMTRSRRSKMATDV